MSQGRSGSVLVAPEGRGRVLAKVPILVTIPYNQQSFKDLLQIAPYPPRLDPVIGD